MLLDAAVAGNTRVWGPKHSTPAVLQPLVNDLDKDVLCKPRLALRLWWLRGCVPCFFPVLVLLLLVLAAAAVLMRLC